MIESGRGATPRKSEAALGTRGETISEPGLELRDVDDPHERVREYAPASRPRSGCVIEQLRFDLRARDDQEARAALRFVELAERERPHECKAR